MIPGVYTIDVNVLGAANFCRTFTAVTTQVPITHSIQREKLANSNRFSKRSQRAQLVRFLIELFRAVDTDKLQDTADVTPTISSGM